ncbi:hypothetical protein RchiOBHm_Chr4g0385081 [Rosa chinensis]|uniref:Uncharacterized protein n=1 Tax=Rosa chinensis TaxID=74649 RepID=A0A2P6QNU7_ROSCH|nr:hypothetical protein RchiOBHm_Chr4g0385081 [Rosa chinensis]
MAFCHRFSTPLVQIYPRNCPCPLWMAFVASASGFASFSTTFKRTYTRWCIFTPKQRVDGFSQSHSARLLGVSWAYVSPVCCVPTGVEGSKMVLWWLILFKLGQGGGSGGILGMELFFPWWLLACVLGFFIFKFGLSNCIWAKPIRGFNYVLLGLCALFAGPTCLYLLGSVVPLYLLGSFVPLVLWCII